MWHNSFWLLQYQGHLSRINVLYNCDNTLPDTIFRGDTLSQNQKRNCKFCFTMIELGKVLPPTFNLNKKFENNTFWRCYKQIQGYRELKLYILWSVMKQEFLCPCWCLKDVWNELKHIVNYIDKLWKECGQVFKHTFQYHFVPNN